MMFHVYHNIHAIVGNSINVKQMHSPNLKLQGTNIQGLWWAFKPCIKPML